MTTKKNYEIVTGKYERTPRELLALDVLIGLSQAVGEKHLPPKWFYDERGSKLFHRITEAPEYYLTRTELSILEQNAGQIAEIIGPQQCRVIELGAGADSSKVSQVLNGLLLRGLTCEYTPVDICEEAVACLLDALAKPFGESQLEISGMVGDYFDALACLEKLPDARNLVLFLGSNIGNLSDEETWRFLLNVWHLLQPGDFLLISFDLKKDPERLLAAYSDEAGLTADFNLNLLRRLNQELEADFDPDAFQHHAIYDPTTDRMRSYLLSRRRQDVRVDYCRRSFHLEPQEPIYVERSRKYDLPAIDHWAEQTGFQTVHNFLDEQDDFCCALWKVKKD